MRKTFYVVAARLDSSSSSVATALGLENMCSVATASLMLASWSDKQYTDKYGDLSYGGWAEIFMGCGVIGQQTFLPSHVKMCIHLSSMHFNNAVFSK